MVKKAYVQKLIKDGGLGNQAMEWATGFRIARELGLPYYWTRESGHKRSYGLGIFGLKENPPPEPCELVMDERRLRNTDTVATAIARVNASRSRYPAVSAPFQEEGCFAPVAGEIRGIFKVEPIRVKAPGDRTLVGVHVRRGDFVRHPEFNVCSVRYYQRAIDWMRRHVRRPFFVVVSDDLDWCRKTFRNAKDMMVVGKGSVETHFRTLVGCDAHIIANSTLGWWAAWLGEKGPVVAPRQWCRTQGAYGPWDPVPDRWHTIGVGQETNWRVQAQPVKPWEGEVVDRAIVIPWSEKHAKWEELRFCLRSVDKFFEDKSCPIYVLGSSRPGFLTYGDHRVTYLDRYLYREALETGVQLARQVLWLNDDQVFLRPSSWQDWENPLYLGKVAPKLGKVDPRNSWWLGVLKALDLLKERGIKEPKVYCTHTPYVFEKEQAMDVLREFGLWEKIPFELLLFNLHPEGSQKMDGQQAIGLPFGEAKVLSYNDQVLGEDLKAAIRGLLPDYAPWELARPFE